MTANNDSPQSVRGDLILSSAPWKIYRQYAGMGEYDYAVFLRDVFFCRAEDDWTAQVIIMAMRAWYPCLFGVA